MSNPANKKPLQDNSNLLSSIGSNLSSNLNSLSHHLQGWAGGQKREDPNRQKIESNSKTAKVEETLLCPITYELPFVPVMAEDGHVYEKSAISEYFFRKDTDQVLSPMTRVKMGKALLAAPQIKNTIEVLIETGVIGGEWADSWNSRKEKQRAEDLLRKAEAGNTCAMLEAAYNYCEGKNGFEKQYEAAFKWFERAHCKESVVGMAEVGAMLVLGIGVKQDKPKGLVYLGIAAGKGSDFASYALGLYFVDGKHGLPVDKEKAVELLKDSLSDKCQHCCMKDDAKRHAKDLLEKLSKGSA